MMGVYPMTKHIFLRGPRSVVVEEGTFDQLADSLSREAVDPDEQADLDFEETESNTDII